jgi:hypothetical protein
MRAKLENRNKGDEAKRDLSGGVERQFGMDVLGQCGYFAFERFWQPGHDRNA